MFDVLAAAGVRLWTALAAPRPDAARDREDDVRALADERVGVSVWPLVWLVKLPVNGAVLGRLVPAEHLDVLAVLLVVVLHAVAEAVHVDRHGRRTSCPPKVADLAGLGHARGQVAAEEAVLDGVEHQRVDVRSAAGV